MKTTGHMLLDRSIEKKREHGNFKVGTEIGKNEVGDSKH